MSNQIDKTNEALTQLEDSLKKDFKRNPANKEKIRRLLAAIDALQIQLSLQKQQTIEREIKASASSLETISEQAINNRKIARRAKKGTTKKVTSLLKKEMDLVEEFIKYNISKKDSKFDCNELIKAQEKLESKLNINTKSKARTF